MSYCWFVGSYGNLVNKFRWKYLTKLFAAFLVTGPYLKRIFQSELGTGDESVINADPLPDFGGKNFFIQNFYFRKNI